MLPKPIVTALRGFCMGAADVVPGVSGGTVALVFGIYERLLASIGTGSKALGHLFKLDVAAARHRLRAVEWFFLVPLLLGILSAVALLSSVIERLLRDRPEDMAGLFFGLVAGSIVVTWRGLEERTPGHLGSMAGVGAVTFVLLGFQSGPVASPPTLAFFGAGAVAICAMILPGISGSFLLLMMGMYAAVLGAVHERAVIDLGVFTIGCVAGLALFSTALNWLLHNHGNALLAALIGLMVGSLRVLWPWPHGVGVLGDDEIPSISGTGLGWPQADEAVVPIVLAVAAFALVVGVSRFAAAKEHRDHLIQV